MAIDDGFRLPGSSYSQLQKIIAGYGHYSQPVAPVEVQSVSGVNSSEVSRNGKFLTSLGILEGGQKKSLTGSGKRLSRAFEYGHSHEEQEVWSDLARQSEFLQKVLAAVRIRHGMERSALQSHIAYSSGQKKSPIVMTGSNATIDILVSAGMLQESDGKLVVTPQVQRSPDEDFPSRKVPETGTEGANAVDASGEKPVEAVQRLAKDQQGLGIMVSININVDCEIEELSELSTELRKLLADVQLSGQDEKKMPPTSETE